MISNNHFACNPGNMDKYRLVEEKYIGAHGFIDENIDTEIGRSREHIGGSDALCIVRITPQAKPRSCITTAMNMLVSSEILFYITMRDTNYVLNCIHLPSRAEGRNT